MSTVREDLRQTAARSFVATSLIEMLRRSSDPAGHCDEESTIEIEDQFREWLRVIQSLPLMTDEYVFAYNWLTSAWRLWRTGDRPAAIYQLKQVASKLGWKTK